MQDDDSLLRSFVTIKAAAEKILSDGTAKYRRVRTESLEENRSVIEPSCTFSKPNNINCLPSNRVLDRKPDRVTGYKVLIDLTSLL
jgi:hypothetical protein